MTYMGDFSTEEREDRETRFGTFQVFVDAHNVEEAIDFFRASLRNQHAKGVLDRVCKVFLDGVFELRNTLNNPLLINYKSFSGEMPASSIGCAMPEPCEDVAAYDWRPDDQTEGDDEFKPFLVFAESAGA